MMSTSGLWEFLSRDASFFGGPQSPMLSWLGSFGIVIFFLWQIMRLRSEVSGAQRPFDRARPMLTTLANERGDIDREQNRRVIFKIRLHSAEQRHLVERSTKPL